LENLSHVFDFGLKSFIFLQCGTFQYACGRLASGYWEVLAYSGSSIIKPFWIQITLSNLNDVGMTEEGRGETDA
jgi:hypothetical protein